MLALVCSNVARAGLMNNFAGTYPLYLQCTMEVADFDHDNDIDGVDFMMWQRGRGLNSQINNNQGDADGNGSVNAIDLEMWMDQLGTTVDHIADSVCFKMYLDPEGVIEGRITSYIDLPAPGSGQLRFSSLPHLIDIHPAYKAKVETTTITFPAGRQRIESKIHFEVRDPANPPAGPVTFFGYQVKDQLATLNLQGLAWGFEFQSGDFITGYDPTNPSQIITLGSGDLAPIPLPVNLPLVLDVNVSTGAMRLRNTSATTIAINSYMVTSASGGLNATGWFSIDDSEADPPGVGWEEMPGSNSQRIGENNPFGVLQIPPGQTVGLGVAYAVAAGARNLQFTFGTLESSLIPGPVNYNLQTPAVGVPEPRGLRLALVLGAATAFRRRRSL